MEVEEGKTFEPVHALVTIQQHGKLLVSLHADGRLEYGSDYNPDEAARAFWGALRQTMPSAGNLPLSGYAEQDLRDELARRAGTVGPQI